MDEDLRSLTPENFLCDVCGEFVLNRNKLGDHKRTQTNRTFLYDVSGETFSHKYSIVERKKCHKDKGFPCDLCGQIFSDKSQMIGHMVSYHCAKQSIITCVMCNETFSSKNLIIEHMKIHFCNKSHCSSLCDENFSESRCKDRHMIKVHKVGPSYHCSVCNKKFYYRKHFVEHTRHHIDGKPTCTVCGKQLSSKSSMIQHMQSHNCDASERVSCNECVKLFSSRNSLNSRRVIHAPVKPFSCPTCGRGVNRRRALQDHKRVHEMDYPGGKSYNWSEDLSRHKTIHKSNIRDENCFSCCVCEKSYVTKATLVEHMAVHTGKCRYHFSCTVCRKEFLLKTTLERHMRIHTTEKSFVCKTCDKRFAYKITMVLHERNVHMREKRFLCSACGKAFFYKHSFTNHKRKHTGEKLYRCFVCSKQFANKISLQSHGKLHTAEQHVCPKKHPAKVSNPVSAESQGLEPTENVNRILHSDIERCKYFITERKLPKEHPSKVSDLVSVCCKKDFETHGDMSACRICGEDFSGTDNVTAVFGQTVKSMVYSECKITLCDRKYMRTKVPHLYRIFQHSKQKTEDIFLLCKGCASVRLQCSLCGKYFSLSVLRIHLGLHTGEMEVFY